MEITTNHTRSSLVYMDNVCREKTSWIFSIMLSYILSPRLTKIYLIKENNNIIGGFTISKTPTIFFHPKKILNREFRQTVQKISKNRKYFSHFLIFEKYREKWFGSQVIQNLSQKRKEKIWLVSEKTAVWFYQKMKLNEIDTKYHIFLIN